MTTGAILEAVEQLPVAEQLAIAEAILHRLRAELEEEADDLRLADELLDAWRSGRETTIPAEQVWRELGLADDD